jgi:GAF domain-containing protein
MKRRVKGGGKGTKPPGRKVPTPRGGRQNARRRPSSSKGNNTPDIQGIIHERDEALQQQAATSQVLKVISGSAGDLQSIFATILEEAVRICDSAFGELYYWEDEVFRLASMHNTPPLFEEERKRTTLVRPEPDTLSGRMLAAKAPVQIIDITEDPLYTQRKRLPYIAAVELGGVRTALAVPMLKDHELVGMIMLSRQEVRGFTEQQIALIESFTHLARPGQGAASARPVGSGLRVVHGGFRHARSEGSEGAVG